MSIWVHRSCPLQRTLCRSSPHSSQKLTGERSTLSTVRVLPERDSVSSLPLPWVPGRVSAVLSFWVCEEGLLELVLFFGVFFSMNTAISTCSSISRASNRARLSAETLPSVQSRPKRSLSAPNSSRRDSLLTLATRGSCADYPPVSTAISAESTARRSPGGKPR